MTDTKQPEALRLADRLDLKDYYEFDAGLHCPQAAAELRRLHAENAALKQQIAPAGWKLVPLEPTYSMLHDAATLNTDVESLIGGELEHYEEVWRAMLVAAPAPEADRSSVEIGPEWKPCRKRPVVVHVREQTPGEVVVSTREGLTLLKGDDLVMRGVEGEIYPIGRDVFYRTYDLLDNEADKPAAGALLEWAVSRWRDEVEHRPLVNKHRRTLDDTWRQVIRYAGGDPEALIGPAHDALLADKPKAAADARAVSDAQCDAIAKALYECWQRQLEGTPPDVMVKQDRAAIRAALGQPVYEPMSVAEAGELMHGQLRNAWETTWRIDIDRLVRAVEKRTAERLGVKVGEMG